MKRPKVKGVDILSWLYMRNLFTPNLFCYISSGFTNRVSFVRFSSSKTRFYYRKSIWYFITLEKSNPLRLPLRVQFFENSYPSLSSYSIVWRFYRTFLLWMNTSTNNNIGGNYHMNIYCRYMRFVKCEY